MEIIRQMILGAIVGLIVGQLRTPAQLPRQAVYPATFQPMPSLGPQAVEAQNKKAHAF